MTHPNTEDPEDSGREIERRRLARVFNQFFVRSSKAVSPVQDEGEKIPGIVHDINASGVAFLTQEGYREGDVLSLEIELPGLRRPFNEGSGLLNSATVVTLAVVVRTETIEPGLNLAAASFKNMEEGDRALIEQAISYQQNL